MSSAAMRQREGACEEVYEVHQIVDKRATSSGDVEYRIRWLGYSEHDDTCASAPLLPLLCHDFGQASD